MNAHSQTLRRHGSIEPKGSRFKLKNHPAVIAGRTIMGARVYDQAALPRLLISGHNSRKIGKTVAKGRWRGMPIFTLTLEERATCPRSCTEWTACYGNSMNWARRIKHGPAFEVRIWDELGEKQAAHPRGFVVRLHVLGDFYSVGYAEMWAEALETFPALQIFGYTAREPESEIGEVIAGLIGLYPSRFAVRFSGLDAPDHGSMVVDRAADTDHLICPAQTGATACCATCALCWQSTRTIAFLRH
ncbi:hypothetical protein [Sphingomonas sp. MMS24-J13]|uniref:GP88 family protein n=1 Tax=Sphingomonas sp. MMS24-J13 TaxID=3238686 RepID=UPI00384DAD22